MVIDNSFYLSLAIKEAWKYQLLTYPNPAVGALILDKNSKILSIEAHQKARGEHAELKAVVSALIKLGDKKLPELEDATKKHDYIIQNYQNYFKDCTIFVTLEPCNHHGSTPPCSLLIERLGFKKLVCGSLDFNPKAKGGLKRLQKSGVIVESGVLKKECDELIEPFLKWQKDESFIFFKIATTLNGVYDGGIISSDRSRRLVHKFRDKVDLLVIGGESVRVDRPTLDARMVNDGKAPDILILSNSDDFDRDIPLFKVKNRKVFIEKNLDRLSLYKFVMIEGGSSMMESCSSYIDWYCFFRSTDMKLGKTLQLTKELKLLNLRDIEQNTIEWLK
jgi:diaminohydroxyphosphoribosylaminopyrimidine deaminase/5-amino-6-(5-phosphoribosylamino)uracil reductase